MVNTEKTSRRNVFISYSRKDEGVVRQISEYLETHGVDVWRDVESISPGESFQDSLRNSIDSADVVLCIVSPNYFSSQWCQTELATAAADRRPIIPVVAKEAADLNSPLRHINSLDCRYMDKMTDSERNERLDVLINAINVLSNTDNELTDIINQENGGLP